MLTPQPRPTASETPFSLINGNSAGRSQTIRRHWEVLANVRNLIDELEHLHSELEVIGNLENEDLPPKGEFFLSLTVDGDNGPTVTRMGVENGRLYLLLSEDARSSQLAVLELR
jgi:hypothetical protein